MSITANWLWGWMQIACRFFYQDHTSLFKLCLSSHGYKLVAKDIECMDIARLHRENQI